VEAKFHGLANEQAIMGLLPNAISTPTFEFRSKSFQNFLAYLTDKPLNLFNDFASKFRGFVTKAHSATVPLFDYMKFLGKEKC